MKIEYLHKPRTKKYMFGPDRSGTVPMADIKKAVQMIKSHEKDWVIKTAAGPFVKHPRGDLTPSLDDAYGWHYKKDAEGVGNELTRGPAALPTVGRRGDFRAVVKFGRCVIHQPKK